MPNSPRMSWPYPAESQDPWFDAFVGLINALDASGFASREDRNIVLMRGGTITFVAGTGVLSWSEPLELLAPITGFLWSIPAGNLMLPDGGIFYVNVVRSPQDNTSLASLAAMQVPPTDQGFLIGIRRGDRVYFRNGAVAVDGFPGTIIEDGCCGGGGGGGTNWNPVFDKFLGTGILTTFALSQLVDPGKLDGVLAHRNGLLSEKVVAPATIDEYMVSNIAGVTYVTYGLPLLGTDRIFVTYGTGGTGWQPVFDKFLGTGLATAFPLSQVVPGAKFPGVLAHRNGMLAEQVAFPATLDEYSVSTVLGITYVTFGLPLAVTDRIFVTYSF